MSEIDNENIDSPNDDEVTDDETSDENLGIGDNSDDTDPTTDDDSADDSDDVEKLKDQNKKLFERAKKAEGFVKDADGNWVKKSKPAPKAKPKPEAQKVEITPLDTIALMESKVTNADDINEVLDYAKLKNISVADALKSNVVKTIIADKVAERTTAQATATKGSKKGASAPDAETIIQQTQEGKFPDDPAELAKARMAQRKSKK